MEHSEILATMVDLKLYGIKAGYDEIITTAVKRQHEPQRIVGDLLQAEIAENQARSIKYQITIAKLPLAKDIGGEQQRPAAAGGAHDGRGLVDDVDEPNTWPGCDTIRNQVHGVGADQHAVRAGTHQVVGEVAEQHAGAGPVACPLQGDDELKVDGAQHDLGRAQPTQPLAHQRVDEPVVHRRAFLTHAADQPNLPHRLLPRLTSARVRAGRRKGDAYSAVIMAKMTSCARHCSSWR